MTSPDWARETTQPRRQGPRGDSQEYQGSGLAEYVDDMLQMHDIDVNAHQFIQQLILQALATAGITQTANGGWTYTPPGVPDATTDRKGISKLLGGSADFPLVPWTAVSGKPSIPVNYSDLQNLPFIPKAYADITGTVPQSALPPIAIVEFLGAVASQSAMLALTGQRGDWCNRTDRGSVFILVADTPANISSWRELSYPTAPVTSVNNRTGAVTGLVEASTLTETVQDIVGTNFLKPGASGWPQMTYDDAGNQFIINGSPPATPTDVQVFTSSSVWTKPAGAVMIRTDIFGGGGGGGAGCRGASATALSGGGGGGAGGYASSVSRAADLDATENVFVGAGGTGGAGSATTGTGAAGNAGGPSGFGTIVRARANGGGGGNGGASGAGSTGGAPGTGLSTGVQGGAGTSGGAGTQPADSPFGPGAGGGGGGISAANASQFGGVGGSSTGGGVAGGARGSSTSSPGNVGSSGGAGPTPGSGGAGGNGGGTGTGGAGGTGGNYGAGGGGGGASQGTSGAGGNGAPGVVVVTTYF